ncbi:MAG: outer membrane protein assembly factor BamE [Deltaproteobacteria bacterium]|nr:MAG: outer membrane protein assembly factor BamE [Deltaproteobacteria bacterium]
MYTSSRLFIIGLTFAIAACTTIGNKFDPDRVDDLKPGISTIADATAVLGPPAFQSPDSNGSRLLQWHYTQISAFSGLSGADIGILFDDTGRMIRVTHSFVQSR